MCQGNIAVPIEAQEEEEEEESRAYLDVLHRLAGLPALSRPCTDQESAGM